MKRQLSCLVTALAAAALFGGEVFSLVTLFDWALLERIGFADDALVIGAWMALPLSLAVAYWIARSAYAAEAEAEAS